MNRPSSSAQGPTTPPDPVGQRYRVLRRLLANNSELLELMADLEADLRHLDPGQGPVREPVLGLLEGSLLAAENLNLLTRDRDRALYDAHEEIEREVRKYLGGFPPPAARPLVLPLHDASRARAREVGGKAASLGELRLVMPAHVPAGFVVTTAAYRLFLEEGDLHQSIRKCREELTLAAGRDVFRERAAEIRGLIRSRPVPRKVADAIADGVMQFPMPWPSLWAARSSAVGEDGPFSFAGQFDSFLNVTTDRLQHAWRQVVESRFSDRAILYRLMCGFTEVDTPMAVLFLPMVEARAAGVLYTRDPVDEAGGRMLLTAVPGLADGLVQGRVLGATLLLSRDRPGEVLFPSGPTEAGEAAGAAASATGPDCLSPADLQELAQTGLRLERHFGRPQDIEWVLAPDRVLWIVQSRTLRVEDRALHARHSAGSRPPLLEGGTTVFPGRAVGPAHVVRGRDGLSGVPDGAILWVEDATPELAEVLSRLSGLVAERGGPGGHAATLIREFGLPALFGLPAGDAFASGAVLSLDATHRRVYEGSLWPEVAQRVRSRLRQAASGGSAGVLHDRLLALSLTNPLSAGFRARGCRSVHDLVRYTHETAVRALFEIGDEAVRQGRRQVWRLETEVPLNLTVMDLGGAVAEQARRQSALRVENLDSVPFRALWRGVLRPGVSWAGRRQVSGAGFASVLVASAGEGAGAVRRLGERNYAIVAPEFLNLNARLAYHFAMVDALVTEVGENNYVNFRLRGGGAGPQRTDLRARFLAEVLLRSDFGVDRRGDLVTAWMRGRSRGTSEAGLEALGALMGCARQLDMLMDDEARVHHFVERFLEGDYGAFA